MTTETDIQVLKMKIENLEKEARLNHDEIEKLKALDEKRMRSAVVALAGVVIALGLYIWRVIVEGK